MSSVPTLVALPFAHAHCFLMALDGNGQYCFRLGRIPMFPTVEGRVQKRIPLSLPTLLVWVSAYPRNSPVTPSGLSVCSLGATAG